MRAVARAPLHLDFDTAARELMVLCRPESLVPQIKIRDYGFDQAAEGFGDVPSFDVDCLSLLFSDRLAFSRAPSNYDELAEKGHLELKGIGFGLGHDWRWPAKHPSGSMRIIVRKLPLSERSQASHAIVRPRVSAK